MTRGGVQRPSWDELNAYVDGELGAAAAAKVAAAVAHDGEAARQVALLAAMKARLQEATAAERAPALTALKRSQTARRPHGRASRFAHRRIGQRRIGLRRTGKRRITKRLAAMAAALLLVALAAGGAWLLIPGSQQQHSTWLAAAIAAHQSFAAADRAVAQPALAAASPSFTRSVGGQAAYLPDLTSGRLTLSALREVIADHGQSGLAAHYLGTRGCRLTLVVLPLPDGEAVPLASTLGQLAAAPQQVYGWRIEKLGYLLIADGMDGGRLKLIAQKIHQAARAFRPLDETSRLALAESRKRAEPCRA